MNLVKKIVAITIILACAVMLIPSSAQAVTSAELQAQIDALLAQLSTLQTQLAGLDGGTTTTVTGCTITSFDQNLKQGMSGDDSKCLQIVLNSAADTQVASTGVGSPGNETSYFGPLTKAGVIKFQEKYASEVLASWGLTSGTGYVGSTTRAKLNELLAGGVEPTDPTDPTDPTTPTGAGLTVALAADTPASSTLVTGQSVASLAKITFTNGDNAEVKVTTIKLKRLGISADATLANVYLFDGATRLTDSASVSSGVITFTDSTGIVKIASAASKTLTVKSDIASSTSGETVGVGINTAADVSTDASSVNGTFPVNGNLMSIASGTLAGASFNTTTTPSAASISPQSDYAVWQNIVSVTTRAVNLTRISLREIGTINYADLQNFRLYVDGVQVGSAVAGLDANGYVTFDLSADAKKLEAGSRTIKVVADIIGGSSRTFSFSLRVAADANFVDSQYGVNVLPEANSTTFSARTTGTQTVSSGTLTFTKASDSPAGNVVNGASNATLAKYELRAAGEKVKVESLMVAVAR
ncbi:peptidoglycan-binding protein, partial [Patescibacteria group bacterium]